MKDKYYGKKAVIYDSLNKLVWIDGEKPIKNGKGEEKWYGKFARRFTNNHQARSYAISLGKKLAMPIFDKYFGEYLTLHERKETLKQERKEHSNFGGVF